MWRGVVACVGALGAVVSCGGGGSGPLLPARISALQRAFDTALIECADRVWPGSAASYSGSQILLVSVQEGTAYLWNDQREASNGHPPQLSMLEITELGPEWMTTFNAGTLFGFPTVGVSLDETAQVNEAYAAANMPRWHDFAVDLTLHEAFHIIGSQRRWPRPGGGGSRSIPYPQVAEPRYLRAALISALLAHVRDGGSDATLAAAAFWQGRFVTEHAVDADAIRGTDINEGTAEYATLVGGALVDHGCAASEATLVQTMVAHLDEFVDVERFDGGNEPYQLGLLAGIGARVRGTRVAGWEGRVESGQTPVEVLVAGTVALAQTDDPTLSAGARSAVDASNLEIAVEVSPLLARMEASDHVRLPIPAQWTAGSFRVTGFVTLVDEPGSPEALLNYRATHEVPDGGPTITVAQTVMQALPEACGSSPQTMRIATFPAAALVTDVASPGRFTLNDPAVSFTGLSAERVQDAAGLTWLCPQALPFP